MGRKKISLDELAQEDCLVLFDTCAICSPIGKHRGNIKYSKIVKKTLWTMENIKFIYQMINKLKGGANFFTTKLVMSELLKGAVYQPPTEIINNNSHEENYLLEFRKTILEEDYKKKKLARIFSEEGKVVESNIDENSYFYLHKNSAGIMRKNKLSNTDIELLLIGLNSAMLSLPIVLVSNDYSIFYSGEEIMIKKGIDQKKIKFFDRDDFFSFRLFEFGKRQL